MSLVALDVGEEIPMDEVMVWKFPLPTDNQSEASRRKRGSDLLSG